MIYIQSHQNLLNVNLSGRHFILLLNIGWGIAGTAIVAAGRVRSNQRRGHLPLFWRNLMKEGITDKKKVANFKSKIEESIGMKIGLKFDESF
jgi:hypothetical protein